jgi:hypothetical protein
LRAGAFQPLRPTWDSAGSVDVPAWPCTGWGLPGRRVAAPPVRSYRTISPLPATGARAAPPLRRCVSVALSRGFPRVALRDHPALRCPDFPRTTGCLSDRPRRTTFAYGPLTLYGRTFQTVRLPARFVTPRPPCGTAKLVLQPRIRNARRLSRIRFGLSPLSLATTQGIETFFIFLRVLRCVISPGSLLAPYVFRCG